MVLKWGGRSRVASLGPSSPLAERFAGLRRGGVAEPRESRTVEQLKGDCNGGRSKSNINVKKAEDKSQNSSVPMDSKSSLE